MGIVSARRAGATVSVAGLLWLIVLCFTGSEQCVQSKFDVPNDQEYQQGQLDSDSVRSEISARVADPATAAAQVARLTEVE